MPEGASKLHKKEAQNLLALPQNAPSVITLSPNSYSLMGNTNDHTTEEETSQAQFTDVSI